LVEANLNKREGGRIKRIIIIMRRGDGASYVKKNEFSREMENERTRERTERERDENARWKFIPRSSVPVGRNFSHKELLRVFIRPENLMRRN